MNIINTQQMTPDMAEAIQRAIAGEEILVSHQGKLHAKITQVTRVNEEKSGKNRQFGFRKGALKYMAPDFNEPLDDFKDYMPH